MSQPFLNCDHHERAFAATERMRERMELTGDLRRIDDLLQAKDFIDAAIAKVMEPEKKETK
jgi:hypothetical protein